MFEERLYDSCFVVVNWWSLCWVLQILAELLSPRGGNILRIDNLVQSGGEVIAVSTWAFDTVGSNECTKGIILAAPWAQDELWF